MKSKLCFGCYDVINKEHSGRNCPNRRKCNIPLGFTACSQRKGHLKKKKDDNYTPPMPPGNEERTIV